MYLICYGTRPELIKLIPLINKFKEKNISFLTLFSGQHQDLISQFYRLSFSTRYYFRKCDGKGSNFKQINKQDISENGFGF